MRTAQIIFCLSILSVRPVFAADKIPAPGKFLKNAGAVSVEDAKSKCVVDAGKDLGGNGSCAALKFGEVGTIKPDRYFFAWYRRSGEPALEQLVLFSAPESGAPLTPVWTDVVEIYDSPGHPITDASLRHGPLGDFLELKYTTGGTAGSYSEYFLHGKSGWTYLQQLAIEEDALKCLPKDFGIQTTVLNLESGTVEVFAPHGNDPLCCPSGRIHLKLKLTGDSLRGTDCRFKKE